MSTWKRFLLLWLFMFLTFVCLKVLFNLWAHGWIDLRRSALLEVLLIPAAQTLLLWFGYRLDRFRTAGDASPPR